MIPHRFRVQEAGTRLLIDLPWLRGDSALFSQTGLDPASIRFTVSRPGAEPVQGMVGDRFAFEVDMTGRPAGVYEVVLDAIPAVDSEGQGGSPDAARDGVIESERKVFWSQRVFVQPSLRRSPEKVDELARRFAPILLFSYNEAYFPVDFHTLLCSEAIRSSEEHIHVTSPCVNESVPVRDLHEYLRYNGQSEALLDQSFFNHERTFHTIRGDFNRSVVYYSYLEDRDGSRFFINFHTFYAFDAKTGIAKMLGVGPHVFDRESMTIVFREDETPEAIILSGHLEGQQILFFDNLKIWSEGRVRLRFDDPATPAVLRHPIVPVAEGSHALYPTAGFYHISLLTELAGHIFGDLFSTNERQGPSELGNHQVLLPPSLTSDRFAAYDLRPLRLDLLRSDPLSARPLYDPDSSCLIFSGYWVDVPGLHNERFPPFSTKEDHIEEWVDGAYPWSWDDLPGRILENNRALSHAIQTGLVR